MKLSVIIPCFNAADTLAIQLEALANQRWSEPWEVIVSDNGSTDDSVTIVEQYKEKLPNLRIVDSSGKQGAAHAKNVGVLAAAGEALAFSDADDEVAPGWVAAMGEALAKYDFVACRLDYEKLNKPWTLKYRGRRSQQDGLQQSEYLPSLPHASGSTIGVKRSLYDAAGGFDESIPILDDTDFCWKIQLKGTKLHFVPEAVVHYRFRHTLDGIYRQARGYGESQVLLYKKYKSLGRPKPWTENIKPWLHLLKHFPLSSSKEDRARWLWQLGLRVGRLDGSFKYRVLAL